MNPCPQVGVHDEGGVKDSNRKNETEQEGERSNLVKIAKNDIRFGVKLDAGYHNS